VWKREIWKILFLEELPLRTRKKMGIILDDIILLFPSGFVLRMVLPLDFIEPHHFILSDSFLLIKYLDKMLNIGKIRLEREPLNLHYFL
jgi:hypothetical protein